MLLATALPTPTGRVPSLNQTGTYLVAFAALATFTASSAIAQCEEQHLPELDGGACPPTAGVVEADAVRLFSYGERGLQFDSPGGNNSLWFDVRLQTRFSNEEVEQDLLPGEPTETATETQVNRGRFKLGGHLMSPRLTVYSEYDFPSNRLIDLRVSYQFNERFNVRAGQWKAEFNRERVDSSGAQQFAERSIATPWFTIDRQQGVVVSGRFANGSSADSSYWFGWLSGAGRGGSTSDAEGLWLGRYQWNFTGELLGFSQSDIGRRKKGAGSAALGLVDGKTQYTSFSSAGGGQLPGFSDGASDRYRLRQVVVETAYQRNGFSWQQEWHWKSIDDRQTGKERTITGGYAQAGVFLSRIFSSAPEPLEFALRAATVDPDSAIQRDSEHEYSLVGNWFFNGHRNKLTADVSYVEKRFVPETNSRMRYRLQWDVSF